MANRSQSDWRIQAKDCWKCEHQILNMTIVLEFRPAFSKVVQSCYATQGSVVPEIPPDGLWCCCPCYWRKKMSKKGFMAMWLATKMSTNFHSNFRCVNFLVKFCLSLSLVICQVYLATRRLEQLQQLLRLGPAHVARWTQLEPTRENLRKSPRTN